MIDRLLSPRLLRPLFGVLALIALTMALLPQPPHTPIDRFGDKFAHMLAFGAMAGVAALAWRDIGWSRIVIALSAFGAAIEVLQAIPMLHRDSDWRDWLADTVATLVALGLARLLARWLPQRPVPNPPPFD